MSQSSARQSAAQPDDHDPATLRARFDAEVLAADLSVPPGDLDQLFVMWTEHRPVRARLRAADIALAEEPSFTQKPAQAGAGVSLPASTSNTRTGGPA